MTPVQIESKTFDNWRDFINSMLLDSGKFKKITPGTKEQSDVEIFVHQDAKGECLTKIEAGYLGDRLFYLNINNPKIPGYVKFQDGEYFDQDEFIDGKKKGVPGLEFNDVNAQGIIREFKKGLQGREIHYLKDGKIVKVMLYPFPESPEISYTYEFEKAGRFERLKNIFYRSRKQLEVREINLHNIFGGI